MYTVLARKWRPQIFEELVGQQTVIRTLQNAISSGRIAHAFLFSGPRVKLGSRFADGYRRSRTAGRQPPGLAALQAVRMSHAASSS